MMKAFKDHVAACDQQQSFCGVSAHWQNGVGVITTRTHTMLLHAMQMWPNVINSEFWSYTFMHAVHLHNCTPRSKKQSHLSPLFSQVKIQIKHQMISKCLGLWFTFSTHLCNLALLVLENGKRDPTRVYMLVICHTM